MTIEHVREVERVECYPNGGVMIVYRDTFDDPNDDLLPVTSSKVIHLAYQDDTSAHLQFVQDVCAGAWTNSPQTPESEEVPIGPVE